MPSIFPAPSSSDTDSLFSTLSMRAFAPSPAEREALARGETARALALYRGPFLPELEDSEWADGLRDEALLALTLELRRQIERGAAEGDHRRVVLLANQYLRVDPHEPEVLRLRLRAAEEFAPPHELAKYTADLRRMFN